MITKEQRTKIEHHKRQCARGEVLLKKGTPWSELSLVELQDIKTAYLRRIVNDRDKVKHLDPRSAKRQPIEAEIALSQNLLNKHLYPTIARKLFSGMMEIIEILASYDEHKSN